MFWQLLILQIGFFVLLLVVLQRFFHGHLTRGIHRVEKLQQQSLMKEEELRKSQEAVIKDCQERIAKTDDEIRIKRAKIEEEIKFMRDQAGIRLENERQHMIEALADKEKSIARHYEREARKTAQEIALQFMGQAFDAEMLRALHDKLTDALLASLDISSEGLKNPETKKMTVISAFSLSVSQKEMLKKKIGLPLEEKIDSELVAGLVVRLDDLVLDGSVKNRFERYLESGS